ncbi:18107_t:CDS:2 [Rhizophagus irregularis]|nr:18107_t:CDS:2 [Rhizophagus irregularis]
MGVYAPFWNSESCVCSKEYYDTLVALKYESESKIAKKPVDLGGGLHISGNDGTPTNTGSLSGGIQNIRYYG